MLVGGTERKSGTAISSSTIANEDLIVLIETHTENLKSIGLELLEEDPSLSSLHSMLYIIDNCLLKNYCRIP